IEIQNVPAGTKLFDITDPTNVVSIGTTSTTTLNAVVPNTTISRKILASNVFNTPSIGPVSFRNIDPSQHDYLIISNRALMKPAGDYSDVVKAYTDYRASSAGGSYDTLLVDINQLYDQFNYGEISPLAIRRFMKWMTSAGNPRYLFLIGKGLDIQHGYHRNPSAFTFHDFVPTAGLPASDILFTAGLNGTNYEPAVPTGRITANTPQDIAAYLDKVKEMEALLFDELWRKELLHLSGGINPGEPEIFKFYLEQFGDVAEDFYLGGRVSSIAKESTDIEFINISEKVNSGVNLITLFGHSSPSQNDFNIGFVSAPELGYNNRAKYPMFLINGCNAGDFFSPTIRYGEDWINTPLKGAVGFMANTSFGYANLLRSYSNTFYNVAYGDSVFIHKGIGDIQQEVVKQFTAIGSSMPYIAQAQQMFLLGDPAVKLFGSNKPDYEISNDAVYSESYSSDPVTALSDSFAIKMIVRNFGRAKEDSLAVKIVRTFNDNTTVTYDSIYYPVFYRDTLEFVIHKEDNGFGNNTFTITLDPLNEINEIDKSNNLAELNLFIPLNAARNLYPQGFAIVNTSSVKLTVQSTDILDDPRDFTIQLDTVDTFDSPFMQQFTVNGKIATKELTLPTTKDTLAFYWRSRLTLTRPDESADWATSSFTYVKNGPEGWAQVHFPQYLSNESSGLVKDSEARLLRLQETITDVSIHTFGDNHPAAYTAVSVKLNQTEYNPVSLPEIQCRDNTLNLIAFNKTTTVPYMPVPVQYPNKRACGRRPEVITSFLSTETELGDGKDLIQYITNVVPGDSVILFSIGNAGYATWSANVKNKLGELGLSLAQISSLQTGEPVIIFAKKGSAAGSASILKTSLSPPDVQELQTEATVTGRFTSGTMTSSVIGPAVNWQHIFTNTKLSEATDQFSFDIVGVTSGGNETIVETGLTNSTVDISAIDAEQYPYLKLVFHTTDEINLTAPQLKKWLVSYTPGAEGVLFFDGALEPQQLKEGEVLTSTFRFQNISQKQFSDSLTVQYNIFNTTSRTSNLQNKKIKAPAPGQETSFNITINTKDKPGLNDVRVYVNPRILPELYYDNNVLDLKDYLNVEVDIFNPVLDVSIDGRYIFNGDFVSSNPAIVIKLWDENSLLPKTDTIGITVFLKYPCSAEDCPFIPIYFKRSDVQWSPASATEDFTMNFSPANLSAGTYTLRVEARDTRNNVSGSEPYEITFVVAEDNSITIQHPYPNPSSSSFFFNVVIFGDNRPDVLRMEIINTSGQVVQEINHTGFFTGTNVFIWDAAHLPAGLYFYRLKLNQAGKELKSIAGKLMLTK
ncbi:MAG TPA: C25 family cysteine peptidase, partial [Cyclobacteriaceae bacterium]|nr:C25 family cysteine peptidase [Cyclobacteriaceae bacterium]